MPGKRPFSSYTAHCRQPASMPVLQELRRIRLSKEMSQERLAHSIGTTASCISDWEMGRKTPQMRNLDKWAKELGYEITLQPRHPDRV
jgi:DNA-binding transcriptional regulator YiaG